uniref:Putative integral membrane protein n=1 Tax=uncultured bacterium Contig224 TaxID=1393538 RepID=W0FHN2_9BACT|nr:putative integral membrane protein [uncultured bacterium Contig224]
MKNKLRIIIPIVIIIAVIVIFTTRADSLREFVDAVTTASPLFILLAAVAVAGRYFMYGWAFQAGFKAIEAPIRMGKMMQIVLAVTFINDTAPTAGMAGSVYMAGWATKKGASTGGAISLVFLDKITFFGSFAIIQTVGLIVLAMMNQLSTILILGSLLIYGLAIIFSVALYLSYKKPGILETVLLFIVKVQNKFSKLFKRSQMKRSWAHDTAWSCQQAARTIVKNPRYIVRMFIRMFLLFVCEFASIALVCLANDFAVVSGIVAAYVAGFIMSMCVVQTVGIIEAVLVAMLMAFGADFGSATAISIVYRGLLFWLPFGFGAIAVQRTSKDFTDDEAPDAQADEALGEAVESEDAEEAESAENGAEPNTPDEEQEDAEGETKDEETPESISGEIASPDTFDSHYTEDEDSTAESESDGEAAEPASNPASPAAVPAEA